MNTFANIMAEIKSIYKVPESVRKAHIEAFLATERNKLFILNTFIEGMRVTHEDYLLDLLAHIAADTADDGPTEWEILGLDNYRYLAAKVLNGHASVDAVLPTWIPAMWLYEDMLAIGVKAQAHKRLAPAKK